MEEREFIRTRCHFSVIFENLWQFWAVIAVILINQLDTAIELLQNMRTGGLKGFLLSEGLWGLLAVAGVTLLVFIFQFLRWRKTWITLDENLIIIERNTLKRVKNTIAVENISAVNMERNLFERVVGTSRIKMDTNSLTTAGKTDVSIVFRRDKAAAFRKAVLEKMYEVKNFSEDRTAQAEERQQDESAFGAGKKVFRYTPKDMAAHCFYTASVFSLLLTLGGIFFVVWYVSAYGFGEFIRIAAGGAIAATLAVLGAAFSLVRKFIAYYDFAVYRDGDELHLRYGLTKLRSYTIPVDKITCLKIEQPCFSRIFKRYEAKVVTIGVGDEEGESSNLTMALPKDIFLEQLAVLLPEYADSPLMDRLQKEDSHALVIKAVKFVKWLLIFAAAAFIMIRETEIRTLYIVLSVSALLLFIGISYLLTHLTAGYNLEKERAILAGGTFTRRIHIVNYEKVQNIKLRQHPLSRPCQIVTGVVYLLNLAVGIPYMKTAPAQIMEDRMIAGVKSIAG